MISRMRVPLGFVAAAIFVVFAHISSWQRASVGLLVAFLGLLLRGWAAGYLEKGKKLAQDGPYVIWRHPLYAGSFFLALGFCVAGTGSAHMIPDAILWVVFLLLFVWIYPLRIKDEEQKLETHFGDAWREFTSKNHRFFPRIPQKRRDDADGFLWARYIKNKEYKACMGFLLGVAVLVVKGLYF
jgi:protein-S-isoprenylcysteine O-methyltransferase Ste14